MDKQSSNPATVLKQPVPSSTAETQSLYKVVQIMSHIRSAIGQQNKAVEYKSLTPRVMIIPDDPIADRLSGEGAWSNDTSRLLKAVEEESMDDLKAILTKKISVNSHGGAFHETPLHRAAQQGWAEGIQVLLDHGATVFSTNQFAQTPLHYASASKSVECLTKLLGAGSHPMIDHKDMRGHTCLHDAAALGHHEGVILLLRAGASVDARDKNDETPLHKAAKGRCISSMLALLNRGADLWARDGSGESVISYILHHLPAGMDALLDHCLITNADKLSSKKLEVSFNFRPLAGSSEMNQMKNLSSMVELGHPKLLLHPLCEAFLLLKWHHVKKLFFIEVIFYFTHAFLATFLILDKFVWQQVEGTTPEKIAVNVFHYLKIWLLFQACLIVVKQVLTIIQSVRTWIFSLWHVLNGVIPILVIIVIPLEWQLWQHHLATITVLLIWVQCMLHIGRFPGCGIYVAMFTRVAKVFLRIFLIFFCLIVAFSMSFYVSRYGGCNQNTDPKDEAARNRCNSMNRTEGLRMKVQDKVYENPTMTFMMTLTMMIGELNFDNNFVEQLENLPWTSHFIYLSFVILVSIILSNLLVALAVNDVQGLRNSAHLERLIKQMELVFQMEKTFGSLSQAARWLKLVWLAAKIKSLVHDLTTLKVFMQPHNPQKGNKLLILEKGFLKELNLRQSHVKNLMECLQLREEEMATDRKLSIRRGKSRPVRTEYSSFGAPVEDDIRESLKQLERSLIGAMGERFDDFTVCFASLSNRIKNLEGALVSAGICAPSSFEQLSRVGSVISQGSGGSQSVGSVKHRSNPPRRATQNGPISLTLPSQGGLRRHLIQSRQSQPMQVLRPLVSSEEVQRTLSQPAPQTFEPSFLQPREEVRVEIEMVPQGNDKTQDSLNVNT